MSGLWRELKDRLAVLSDPYARTLRNDVLKGLLTTKPTAFALDALRADSATLEEIRQRDEATRTAVYERRLAAVERARDRGERAPESEPDEQAPEWKATLERLDALAAELGLKGRTQIGDHLMNRRRILVDHLVERFKAEGEPTVLVGLRRELAKLTAEGWQLQREQREAQKAYREFGATGNPANVEREAEIVALEARLKKNDAEACAIKRRLSAEFGIDR